MSSQHPPFDGDDERTAPVPPYGAGSEPAQPQPHPQSQPQFQQAPAAQPSYQQAPPPQPHPWQQATAGRPDPTTAFPFGFGSPVGSRPEPTRGGGARTAGLLAAALVVGGLAGVGGAAGFKALDDDRVTTVTASPSTDRPAGTDRTTNSTDAEPAAGSAEQVAATVLPSVVKINVSSSSGQGSGSGIILSADGEILTNDHVVEVLQEGGQMTVDFTDGSSAEATLVGTDPVTDLAVIKAQDVSGLTAAQIGDSDALKVGEGVVAIGSPFGLEATVTSGIVSSLNRPVNVGANAEGTNTTYPAIQTDAAINPGNSGGPLVNLAGQVVGINSSIRSASSTAGQAGSIGLGFAIPITKVLPIVDQLRNGEEPTHALLGVSVPPETEAGGLVNGATIAEVTEGSAAAEAGLRAGDVVTRVDDQPITSSDSLVATIRGHRPGDTVTLTVRRDGESLELQATLESDAD